jgi:signal transduction protein with GAF and PtsI domain
MKNLVLKIAFVTISLAACNNSSNKSTISEKNRSNSLDKSQAEYINDSTSSAGVAMKTVSIRAIINAYLQMKNAFTEDNTSDAATAGKTLETVFKNFDKSVLTMPQKKSFEDIVGDAKEHAEHIGKNGGNIKHQREHFVLLSKDIYDLIKTFGTEQVLYKDFDQMVNKGKGAFWISETKEIKNPYMGKAMLNSGTIKETIK